MISPIPCNTCATTGKVSNNVCDECHGIGYTAVDENKNEYYIEKKDDNFVIGGLKKASSNLTKPNTKSEIPKQIGDVSKLNFGFLFINAIILITIVAIGLVVFLLKIEINSNIIFFIIFLVLALIFVNIISPKSIIIKGFIFLRKSLWDEPNDFKWALKLIKQHI